MGRRHHQHVEHGEHQRTLHLALPDQAPPDAEARGQGFQLTLQGAGPDDPDLRESIQQGQGLEKLPVPLLRRQGADDAHAAAVPIPPRRIAFKDNGAGDDCGFGHAGRAHHVFHLAADAGHQVRKAVFQAAPAAAQGIGHAPGMDQAHAGAHEPDQGPQGGGAGVVGVQDFFGGECSGQAGQVAWVEVAPGGQGEGFKPPRGGLVKDGGARRGGHTHPHSGPRLFPGQVQDLPLPAAEFAAQVQVGHPAHRGAPVRRSPAHASRRGWAWALRSATSSSRRRVLTGPGRPSATVLPL